MKAEDIDEARNTLIQVYWRIQANNIIVYKKCSVEQEQVENEPWFIDKEYDESIKKVVGEAIADCVTNMGYFKNKKAGEIIKLKFKGEKTPETYEQKHWNAVVLWNYVNQKVKCEGPILPDLEFCLKDLGKSLEEFYGYIYHDKIDRSIKNITAYIRDLDLESILDSLLNSINKNDIAIPNGNRVNAISSKTFDNKFKPKLGGVIDNIEKLENVSHDIADFIGINTQDDKWNIIRQEEFLACISKYVYDPLSSSRYDQRLILNTVNKNNDIIVFNNNNFKCITKFKPPKDYVMYLCNQLDIAEEFFKECELSEQDLKNFDKYKTTKPGCINFRGMPQTAAYKIKNDETALNSFKKMAKLYFQTCIDIENKIQKLTKDIKDMFDKDPLYNIGNIKCYFDNDLKGKLPYFSIKNEKISIPYLRSTSWTESVEQGIKISKADSKIQEYLHTLFDGLPLSYE